MITFRQIFDSYTMCRKNKRNTINQLRFEVNAEQNLLALQSELNDRTYRPRRSICFVVNKPKLREIFAADFRDRIVHHLLVSHLELMAEPIFIHDSYACRKGKGTHAAVKRLQSFMRSITENNSKMAYCLQLDVRAFFFSINKGILFKIVEKYIRNADMMWIARAVIFNDCTRNAIIKKGRSLLKYIPSHKTLFGQASNKGLPIGNLTSQFFANLYLNQLDQFIKHTLKCRYYLRYMDDLLILHRDKRMLENWTEDISDFLRDKLDLFLNESKTIMRPVSDGVDYLGYIVRPFYILVRRRVVSNIKSRLYSGTLDKKAYASYMGHFKHANTYNLRQHINQSIMDRYRAKGACNG